MTVERNIFGHMYAVVASESSRKATNFPSRTMDGASFGLYRELEPYRGRRVRITVEDIGPAETGEDPER